MSKVMVRLATGTAACAVLLALAGCAGAPAANDDSEAAAIKAVSTAFVAAAEKGDAAAWLALWDEGGIQMPPNAPARTREQLAAHVPAQWKARVETVDLKMTVTALEVEVAGPWAFKRGVYTQELTNRKTGQKTLVDAKNLTVFKRQRDGSWKIYRDCFNSNLPPGQ